MKTPNKRDLQQIGSYYLFGIESKGFMKLYKINTKVKFSFLVNHTILTTILSDKLLTYSRNAY